MISLLAVVLLAVVVAVIARAYQGGGGLLRDVEVQLDRITPNADGDNDATRIGYELTRNATVSIYLEPTGGASADETTRYYFRRDEPRGVETYSVLFSGVVDGYTRPDEQLAGEIVTRLAPDGAYDLVIEATAADGTTERVAQPLIIVDGDPTVPEMRGFEIWPPTFSPNRDGIADRAAIQFDLQKDVARLQVYLETADGGRITIQEKPLDIKPLAAGRHIFDYEGGVDLGVRPQPDGTYTIVAEAEDAEGQRTRVSGALTLRDGGLPRAQIISPPSGDTVAFSADSLTLCDTLYFTLTVENYGEAPIRTTGPAPGTVYDSDWNYNTIGWPTESGAFRVAIGFENETSNYQYRWGLGDATTLREENGFYYLDPGERAVITGGVRLVGPLGIRNPQPMWAGLIHEDVEIPFRNDRVGARGITLDVPSGVAVDACPARDPESIIKP